MKNALAPVAALLISVSILLTGQGLQGTLLPVRAGLVFRVVKVGKAAVNQRTNEVQCQTGSLIAAKNQLRVGNARG